MAAAYWMGIFCLVVIGSATAEAQEATTVTVSPSALRVQASASCCPVDSADATCREEQCPIADQLLNVADEDALTELVVDFVSDDSENGPRVQYSFFLEQVYEIASVTLLSTTQFLPRNWTLIFSSENMTSQQAVFEFTNDGLYEQRAVPRKGEDQVQASHVQLLVDLPSVASPEPVSLAEVIITVTGFGLSEEEGCGNCVQDLTDSLDELIMEIRNSTDLLASVNETQQQILQQEIMESQFSVREYEDMLLVLAVVLGVHPPLDSSINISSSVLRLDLTLTPSLPIKLEQLASLVEAIGAIDMDVSDFEMLLDLIEPQLQVLVSNLTELTEIADFHRNGLMELVSALNSELINTSMALMEATQILEVISRRNFSAEMMSLEQYESVVGSALALATTLWEVAVQINAEVNRVNVTLRDFETLLQDTLAISQELSCQSSNAQDNSERVNEIILALQNISAAAVSLNVTLTDAISNVTRILENTEQSLQAADVSLQSSQSLLTNLSVLVSLLDDDVSLFRSLLLPYRPPESCDRAPECSTEDEQHAEMLSLNASQIVDSPVSIYTLRRAREFLRSVIEAGQLFNYTEIIEIAFRAISVGNEALNTISPLNITLLRLRSSRAMTMTIMLEGRSLDLANTANSAESRVNSLESDHSQLLSELLELEEQVPIIRNQTSVLLERTGLEEEANQLFLVAEDALNRTIETNRTITGIEEGLQVASDSIIQTRRNVIEASEALDIAESKFSSIRMFLNETQEVVNEFVFNVTTFIDENDRIISQIDEIIAGLADIHESINNINSPIVLADGEEERSYLSLQPPPGRVIGDAIQFESLDLYIRTAVEFRAPSLLFYAGPVYMKDIDDITAPREESVREDYFLLTVEMNDMLRIEWNMGDAVGNFITPGFVQDFGEIFMTRHGSQFEVRYGVRGGSLGNPNFVTMGTNINGSQLFQTSNRTAFLLGGWPKGAQLGLPSSVVPLSRYNSFQGQVQLLLFNGEQWGLWNIRGASQTNFIGGFFSNTLVESNSWVSQISAFPLSFDGRGYLFVERFWEMEDFSGGGRRGRFIIINIRPNDERDGLVLYTYDEDLMVSMEVAYSSGNLRLLITDHAMDRVIVNYTQPSLANDITEMLSVRFVERGGFVITVNSIDEPFPASDFEFFNNLTNVKAWYGGVRESLLKRPYVPVITTTGFQGCLDIATSINNVRFPVLGPGDFFDAYYFNSTVQKGLSYTCLLSIYMREAAFEGTPESYLPYSHLQLVFPRNHPAVPPEGLGLSADGAWVISLSFVSQRDGGVLLAAFNQESYLAIVLVDREVQLRVGSRDGHLGLILGSTEKVELGAQHYVLIELSIDNYNLFLNGFLCNSASSLPGLSFELITQSFDGSPPVLYIGGMEPGSPIQDVLHGIPPFSGCMKDVAFNFSAMSFINNALPLDRRYPQGVRYSTCPLLNVSSEPILAVHPDSPLGRVCLAAEPSEVEGTHGGFHRLTSLATSNVIGLIRSAWTLSMRLRQMSDGHVTTIGSELGHMIRLAIRNGRAVLTLREPGEESLREVESSPLVEGVFIPVSISCAIDNDREMMSCSLSVDGVTSGQLVVGYPDPIFSPQLPLVFGRVSSEGSGEIPSFIGCISDLSTNGVTARFSGIQTGVQCYNRTQRGYGFTGISHLSVPLSPSVPSSPSLPDATPIASVTFQPQLDNGLVLMLTDKNGTLPVLAVGLFNGELVLSNFSESIDLLPNTPFCNPENPLFHNLSLTIVSGETIQVAIQHGNGRDSRVQPINLQQPLTGETLLLTIGNAPSGFTIAEDSDPFRFLLSLNVPRDSPPPGLFACVSSLIVEGGELQPTDASMENLLIGVCPST